MRNFSVKHGVVADIVKVLSGNIVAQGLAFLVTVLVSRDLGPNDYGDYALIVAIFTCITQLSDFGTATSYVRFLSRNKGAEAEALGTMVLFKLSSSALLAFLIWLAAPSISAYFFGAPRFTSLFELAAAALVFHSLLSTLIAHLQGLEQFRTYSLVSIAHHGLRLVSAVVIALMSVRELHFTYYLYTYFFVAAGIVIAVLTQWDMSLSLNWRFIKDIYGLGFWIFLSSVAVIVQMRIDVVMLQKLASPLQAGLYSAASSVAMIFPLITMSITATLMPKMDGFLKDHTVRQFIAKAGRIARLVIIGCIALETVSPAVIGIFFGSAYHGAIPVFEILIVSYMFGVIVNPISLIYYQVNQAHILTLVNWAQLGIAYAANLLLIPLYGAIGAACSSLLLHIFSSAVIVGYLYVTQPTLPEQSSAAL